MKTIQMTLDEELISQVDELVAALKTTRSAFTRHALREALQRHREAEMEARHIEGYRMTPEAVEEFAIQEKDRVWGDEQ